MPYGKIHVNDHDRGLPGKPYKKIHVRDYDRRQRIDPGYEAQVNAIMAGKPPGSKEEWTRNNAEIMPGSGIEDIRDAVRMQQEQEEKYGVGHVAIEENSDGTFRLRINKSDTIIPVFDYHYQAKDWYVGEATPDEMNSLQKYVAEGDYNESLWGASRAGAIRIREERQQSIEDLKERNEELHRRIMQRQKWLQTGVGPGGMPMSNEFKREADAKLRLSAREHNENHAKILLRKPRKITNRELADLPQDWNNPTVDTSKFHQSVWEAWEVNKELYEKFTKKGVLTQEHEGRYYTA